MGFVMTNRKRGRIRETFSVVVAVVLTLILFPWPVVLLFVLGVPLGSWPYFVVLAAVIGFAIFIEYVTRRGWPARFRFAERRGLAWPHRKLMFLLGGLFFAWYIARWLRFVDVVTWLSVVIVLLPAFALEASIVRSERRRTAAQVYPVDFGTGAKIR